MSDEINFTFFPNEDEQSRIAEALPEELADFIRRQPDFAPAFVHELDRLGLSTTAEEVAKILGQPDQEIIDTILESAALNAVLMSENHGIPVKTADQHILRTSSVFLKGLPAEENRDLTTRALDQAGELRKRHHLLRAN